MTPFATDAPNYIAAGFCPERADARDKIGAEIGVRPVDDAAAAAEVVVPRISGRSTQIDDRRW